MITAIAIATSLLLTLDEGGPGRGPGLGHDGPGRGNLGRGNGGAGYYSPGGGGEGGRGGRGRDGGDCCPDKSNCFKHVTTVGGQALNVAKLSDGSWDTIAITNGNHDFLAKKQTHVQKKWYPLNEYVKLEPLERRKLFIQQKADGVTKPPVRSVNAVSVDGTTAIEIPALTTVVSSLQSSVEILVDLSAKQNRRIAKIKKLQANHDIFPTLSDESLSSDDEDNTKPSATASVLGCGRVAGGSRKRRKN